MLFIPRTQFIELYKDENIPEEVRAHELEKQRKSPSNPTHNDEVAIEFLGESMLIDNIFVNKNPLDIDKELEIPLRVLRLHCIRVSNTIKNLASLLKRQTVLMHHISEKYLQQKHPEYKCMGYLIFLCTTTDETRLVAGDYNIAKQFAKELRFHAQKIYDDKQLPKYVKDGVEIFTKTVTAIEYLYRSSVCTQSRVLLTSLSIPEDIIRDVLGQ